MLTIEHPLTGEKFQVANKDFSDKMTWKDAIDACKNLGSGWRLPTKEELEAMYEELQLFHRFSNVCGKKCCLGRG